MILRRPPLASIGIAREENAGGSVSGVMNLRLQSVTERTKLLSDPPDDTIRVASFARLLMHLLVSRVRVGRRSPTCSGSSFAGTQSRMKVLGQIMESGGLVIFI